MEIDTFSKLSSLNVNDKTEKKGKFTYLSWAWAWQIFVTHYPSATYEIVKNQNGMPYFMDETGGMVYTRVKADSIIHEMWLPIMDIQNKAKKNFDVMDVNKAVMRCLVKNLAMFGLGTYIYAGEDLPDGEEQVEQPPQTPQRKINQLEGENLMELIEKKGSDLEKFCGAYKVTKIGDLTMTQYQDAVKKLNMKADKLDK